jgi:large subunit ribosomal protein L15
VRHDHAGEQKGLRDDMALGLHNLESPTGANKKKKRVGRGPGSGHGKTSTRGNKGQKSRSGYSSKRGFEGGQMPLHRRLPKRGFTNVFKKEWTEVNLKALERVFDNGENVTPQSVVERGLVKKIAKDGLVVLGHGDISKSLNILAHRCTEGARKKIEAAGGSVELVAARSK